MALGAVLFRGPAPADEHVLPDGITVTGNGEALAGPDCLEIDVGATGSGELTGDAIVKYRDRLRRVTEAFKKLDIKQLQINERDLLIHNGVDERQPRSHVTITRALRIVITGIRRMPEEELLSTVGRVIDAAKDTDVAAQEAQPGVFAVRFSLQDPKAVREQASRKAFEDAQEQASRLARLAGGKLGRPLAVADVPAAANTSSTVSEVIQAIYGQEQGVEPEEQGRIVSAGLKQIPVRISMRVRFELLPGEKEGSQEAAPAVVDK